MPSDRFSPAHRACSQRIGLTPVRSRKALFGTGVGAGMAYRLSRRPVGGVALPWNFSFPLGISISPQPFQSSWPAEKLFACARRSWRDPAGGSPVRVGGSARPVASVAGSSVTVVAKRTQRDDEDCIELRKLLRTRCETSASNRMPAVQLAIRLDTRQLERLFRTES